MRGYCSVGVVVLLAACVRSGYDPAADGSAPGDTTILDAPLADLDGALPPLDGAPPTLEGGPPPHDTGTVTNSVTFSQQPAASPPGARHSTGAALQTMSALQSSHDRIWVFGGSAGQLSKNDLYYYDTTLKNWVTPTQSNTPDPRERHSLAWCPDDNVLVLFGGQDSFLVTSTHHDDLFIHDPATDAWTQVPKAGTWPAPRKDAALVWVPHRKSFLLYGGSCGTTTTGRFADLWELKLTSNGSATWTQISPVGGVPGPAQSGGCVVYDPAGRRLILFGGQTSDTSSVNTTYQYLVDANLWQKDSPTGSIPGARSFPQCAWDPVAQRVLLHGGQHGGGGPTGGTYTYDPTGKTWTSHSTPPPQPGARANGGTVYSPALGGMFWFGGRTGLTNVTNQSWLMRLK